MNLLQAMQTQDVPGEFIFKLWPWLEANRNRLIGVLVGVIVISGIWFYFSSAREQKELEAGQALSALTISPPAGTTSAQAAADLEQIATKYSGTAAGQRAWLEAAGALFDAGNYADAQAQFQRFREATPTGPLAATAELGVAASLEAQNKLDEASAAYQRVTALFPDSTSVQPAEFALGRIAAQQNKLNEALTHFENASRSGVGGSMSQEAMLRVSEIRARLAAAAPKSAAAPAASAPLMSLPNPKP